jgi:hypothetical protein
LGGDFFTAEDLFAAVFAEAAVLFSFSEFA